MTPEAELVGTRTRNIKHLFRGMRTLVSGASLGRNGIGPAACSNRERCKRPQTGA